MIARLIRFSLENRFLVLCATVLVFGSGLLVIRDAPVDAMPDLSENQVIVFADWPGCSPREVEDQVTRPLSVNLQGLAGVRSVRATSMFGFSLLTVVFADRMDSGSARTHVLERLNSLGPILPAGVTPRLGPDASGLGWVYQYYLKDTSGRQDLGSLRALQDYFVREQLAAVPGVAEIAGIGGFVRQWQVEVSALRLRQLGVTLADILAAIARGNLNVGGHTLEENGREFVVRGRGLLTSAADLESIVLTGHGGAVVCLRDVATVQLGGDERRGVLDVGGREVVGGTVVMRTGESAWQVIRDVKARIAQIQAGLPAGVTIEAFYDRSDLIGRAIGTLQFTLWESVALVTLMHVLFLFHFRSILIVTLPLPASILFTFILMAWFGIPSHIMSLTGIVIALGVLVDAGIVMVENVIRHGELATVRHGRPLTRGETWQLTFDAATQVGRPICFAMGIIILAFLPIFALTGQEGKLFHPLAWTKTFAMTGATLLSVTLVPVLCTFLVRGRFRAEDRNWLMRALLVVYDPVLDWALRRRRTVLAGAGGLFAVSCVLAFGLPRPLLTRLPFPVARHFAGLGSEFMPTLEEGSLLFMPVLLPGTALTEVKRIMAWQDKVIADTPEVLSVAGKLGRFESATDPAPVEMIETTIRLKPPGQWRPDMTKDRLIAELTAKLAQVPGYVPGFLQPIENRILMLSTGIRAQFGVKIFGDDLDALQRKADEIAALVTRIPGATGVTPSRVSGKPYLEIVVDRPALAAYGLSAADVMDVVETGLGGRTATTVILGAERRPVQVRFSRADREDLDRLAALPVPVPPRPAGNGSPAMAPMQMLPSLSLNLQGRMGGMKLPPATAPGPHDKAAPGSAFIALGQVATIRRVLGPSEIASENGRLRAFVQANVTERDLGGFAAELQARIAADITLEPGMTLEYSGRFEQQLRARRTLQLVVPVVLGLILLLLTLAFRSASEAAHVFLAVPFALTGGVFLQWLLGLPFSVAVWIGYIALFGTAIQTGIVMVVYLEEAVARKRAACGPAFTRMDLLDAVKEGARLRLRPKVMTVATTVAGLLPIFWSTRTGTEVMRPIAAPVVGGMLSSLLHILIVTPVLFTWLRERELRRADA